MPSKCPPGVFCMEYITILIICLIIFTTGIWVYFKTTHLYSSNINIGRQQPLLINNIQRENIGTNNERGNDVFLDVYKAPLRNDNCSIDMRGNIPIPINVATQGCNDAKYRQVGILTRLNGNDETILPLFGRPLITRRDKWNFYTLNDKNNMIKLPVTVKGRSGTNEYGCDNVYTGDTVYVEGYNGIFKVTSYDNESMRYLPSM